MFWVASESGDTERLSRLSQLSDSQICSLSIRRQKSLWGIPLDTWLKWGWWAGLAEEGRALLGLSTTDFSLVSRIKILFCSYTPVLDLEPEGMTPHGQSRETLSEHQIVLLVSKTQLPSQLPTLQWAFLLRKAAHSWHRQTSLPPQERL